MQRREMEFHSVSEKYSFRNYFHAKITNTKNIADKRILKKLTNFLLFVSFRMEAGSSQERIFISEVVIEGHDNMLISQIQNYDYHLKVK